MTSRPPRASRALAATATAVLLAAGLGACGDGDSDASAEPAASPSASTGEEAGDYASYVALGDSYTSAPFVPETDDGDGCLRSSGNYPSLVADELGSDLDDVSCAGAQTLSLVGVQRTFDGQTQPAQFDALDEDTDLVTIGIGGNDFGLFSTLTSSGLAAGEVDSDDVAGDVTGQLDQVTDRVTSALAGVRDRAPDARVVLVGYPQLVPAQGSCPDLLPLDDDDLPLARTLNRGLADALENAAAKADVDYVDLYSLSKGHDICADDPWVNGQDNDPERALAFHPFAAGQEAVADEVLRILETS